MTHLTPCLYIGWPEEIENEKGHDIHRACCWRSLAPQSTGGSITPLGTSPNELQLYGNLDLRQVNLAFNGNERIETVLVREGDRVEKGQVVGDPGNGEAQGH